MTAHDATTAPDTDAGDIEYIPAKTEKELDPEYAAHLIEFTKAALANTVDIVLAGTSVEEVADAAVVIAEATLARLRKEGAI